LNARNGTVAFPLASGPGDGGAEAALRDIYQIDGLAALQERWLAFAREQLAVDVASSRDPVPGPADTRRE
jgi:hypothetical protein